MADQKISELPLRSVITPTDLIPLVSDDMNYKTPISSLVGLQGLIPESVPDATYTPVYGDQNAKLKIMSAPSGALITLPPGIFSIPTILAFQQGAAGALSITAGAGVTATTPDGHLPISAGEGHILYAILLAPNTFTIYGGLVVPRLEAIIQLACISRTLSSPPGGPIEGDRYIPAASATGAWAGKENQIAHFIAGTWLFYPPGKGWLSGIDDEDIVVRYNGASWVAIYQPEVGVWTPTLIGLTSGTATLATANGGYIRSGNHIHTHCHLVTSDTASLSGQLAISSLPFEASTLPGVAGRTGGIIPFWDGLTLPAGTTSLCSFLQDVDNFRLYRAVLTGLTQAVTDAHITSAVTLYCTHAYKAA